MRRLQELQQGADRAFREHVSRHKADIMSRQIQFRERFPTIGTQVRALQAPDETPADTPPPQDAPDLPATDGQPPKSRKSRPGRQRFRKLRAPRRAPQARPKPEPKKTLSAEEQKILSGIEIFESLWLQRAETETSPSPLPASPKEEKGRFFLTGLFDLSPKFQQPESEDKDGEN